jgi:uncharacterized protein (DUF1778 family)
MKRENRINLYATDDERKRLEKAADRAGLPLSSWIRLVALKAAMLEEGTPDKELGGFIAKS